MVRFELKPREVVISEHAGQHRKKSVFFFLVPILIAGFCVVPMHRYQDRKISSLRNSVNGLEYEARLLAPMVARIKEVDNQRQVLNQLLDEITDFDRDRYLVIHVLDELNRNLPKSAWLTRFEYIGNDQYDLEGIESCFELAYACIDSLSRSPYFSKGEVIDVVRGTVGEEDAVRFHARLVANRH